MELQHFSHSDHPLVFNKDERMGLPCYGCREPVFGPSYSCMKCNELKFYHHKLCAELPLGLHHPLHPAHPLILIDESTGYLQKENSKCIVCKEFCWEYSYCCYRCDFNIHIKCGVLELEAEFHDHPLTPICKLITFTCDLCGKEDKGVPNLCSSCGFWIHNKCAHFPEKIKVARHRHLLHLTHSSLVLHESDSRFCQLCVQKVETRFGLYYCSRCDFVAHLDCAMVKENREDTDLQELKDEGLEHDEIIGTFEVKKINVGEDGTQQFIEIAHFSHNHDLKFTHEVLSNEKCDGCVQAILSPFYSCVNCSFFLHESCAKLPKRKRHPLHRHPLHRHSLTLFPTEPGDFFLCNACLQRCNGFVYRCEKCHFDLDVQCSLILDILTHHGHEHRLLLASGNKSLQSCSCCDSKTLSIFRCTTCEFALDFKCATLPHSIRYKQHEHPLTLHYTAEDDSGEYYCDICEEERDPKHWFYYCADCNYPTHIECIFGDYPNYKFGGAYKVDCHPHPLTFIEKTKDYRKCKVCKGICKDLIYHCAQCNFYIHDHCL